MKQMDKHFKALVEKITRRFRQCRLQSKVPFVQKDPVSVFHHIPKCGGSSLRNVLSHWFITKSDYSSERKHWIRPVNPEKLCSLHCLMGHFAMPGYHISERYPEIFANSERFRVFSMLRDPLRVRLSLRRYQAKRQNIPLKPIEEQLFEYDNYLASVIGCDATNFSEVIDRYKFIGILEYPSESMRLLADILQKPRIELPRINVTKSSSDWSELDELLIEKFKRKNALDYEIYELASNRFFEHCERLGIKIEGQSSR